MNNLKVISIIAIPYFTVCAALYHIAYWSTFNINGLAYISLADLIKSAVYPIVSAFGFTIVSMLFTEATLSKVFPRGEGRETPVGRTLNSKIVLTILVICWFVLLIVLYFYGTVYRWITWAFLAGLIPSIAMDRMGVWRNEFTDHQYRILAIRLMVFIPVFSFAAGKYNSGHIYENSKYQYTSAHQIIPNMTSLTMDTIKLIGITEKNIFLTDLNNSRIFILKSDYVDLLELKNAP